MILKLKANTDRPSWNTTLFFSEENGGIRVEEHTMGTPNQCTWGTWLSADQAKELRQFLDMKGF